MREPDRPVDRIPQDYREAIGMGREQTDAWPVGDQGIDVVDDGRRRINARDIGAVDRARDGQRFRAIELEMRANSSRDLITAARSVAWVRPTDPRSVVENPWIKAGSSASSGTCRTAGIVFTTETLDRRPSGKD
jgi:hypothetical protein